MQSLARCLARRRSSGGTVFLALVLGILDPASAGTPRFVRDDTLGLADLDAYISTGPYGPGVSAVDLDGDLDLDLFVANEPHGNRAWNNRPGGPVDIAAELGLAHLVQFPPMEERQNPADPELASMMPAFFDFDNDGDKDLYLTSWNSWNRFYRQEADGTFTDLTGLGNTDVVGRSSTVAVADYNRDGFLDFYFTDWGEKDHLFKNLDGTTFGDVSRQSGVLGPDGEAARPGFCAIWFYQDDDNLLDLYVGNDWGFSNFLFRNLGGAFLDHAPDCFPEMTDPEVDHRNATMGQALGDYDRDGDYDLYVANTPNNNLYRRDGSVFVDLFKIGDPITRGMKDNNIGWFCDWPDVDNDGWVDLFLVNGYIPLCPREDPGYPYDCGGFGTPNEPFQKNRLWHNQGGSFADVSVPSGLADRGWGRGAAVADFDLDGDVDVFVTNNDGNHGYFRNESEDTGHWLTVRLVGTISNRDAIGTRVLVEADGVVHQRDLWAASGYLSQPPDELYFGLGDADRADRVTVVWPRGPVEVWEDVAVDQRILLTQGSSEAGALPDAPAVTVAGADAKVTLTAHTATAEELLAFRVEGDGWASRIRLDWDREGDVWTAVDDAVEPGQVLRYHVAQRTGGVMVTAAPVEVEVEAAVEPREIVLVPRLLANVPNPFNPATTMPFVMPGESPARAQLRVYDAAGRWVTTLVDEVRPPGEHRDVTWDGTTPAGLAVGSGVYFAQLVVEGHAAVTRKVTLIR